MRRSFLKPPDSFPLNRVRSSRRGPDLQQESPGLHESPPLLKTNLHAKARTKKPVHLYFQAIFLKSRAAGYHVVFPKSACANVFMKNTTRGGGELFLKQSAARRIQGRYRLTLASRKNRPSRRDTEGRLIDSAMCPDHVAGRCAPCIVAATISPAFFIPGIFHGRSLRYWEG